MKRTPHSSAGFPSLLLVSILISKCLFDGGLLKNLENNVERLSLRKLDEHLHFPSVMISILIAMLLAVSSEGK